MEVFHRTKSIRNALAQAQSRGETVGFVPTMGNLHAAHIALVETALKKADIVVVSIFVNRLQFGLNEDWDKYPRTLESDIEKLQKAGCHYLFCPDEKEIYPNGMDEQTRVIVPSMSNILCGASRPGHFEGVTTVVSKLLNIIQPDFAVFGIKDYQQLAIIRRMIEDLCIPVDVLEGDIVREQDGLAMSSRNSFISPEERPKADILYRSLVQLSEKLRAGCRDFRELELAAKKQISQVGFTPDYVTVCNSRTLEPAVHDDLQLTILGAMYTQGARLIDNISLSVPRVK